MFRFVEKFAAFRLSLTEAGSDLEVLHLAADLEVLEYVAGGREVELLLLRFDVFVLLGRIRFGRACYTGIAFQSFSGSYKVKLGCILICINYFKHLNFDINYKKKFDIHGVTLMACRRLGCVPVSITKK